MLQKFLNTFIYTRLLEYFTILFLHTTFRMVKMNEWKNGLFVVVIVCRLGPLSTLPKPPTKSGIPWTFSRTKTKFIVYCWHVSMPMCVCVYIGQTKGDSHGIFAQTRRPWSKTHFVFRQPALFHGRGGCFVFSSFAFYRFRSLQNPSPRSNYYYLRVTNSEQNITNITVIRYRT